MPWQAGRGLLALFEPTRRAAQGCYHCLFPAQDEAGSCANAGILGPMAGLIASQLALEALRFLVGLPGPNSGQVLRHDALSGYWQRFALSRDPGCPVCGSSVEEQ